MMTRFMRACAVVSVAIVVAFTGACGNSNQTTTPTTPTTTSPTTAVFASRLTPGGAISRSFAATTSGTITVMLTNAAGPFTRVGLGLGVPSTGIAKCALSTAVSTNAGATPQIAAAVDAGNYCVTVYDIGTISSPVDFSVTLVYP